MEKSNTLDALLKTPRLSQAMVSHDCAQVAWVWAGIGEHPDAYVARTDIVEAPRRLTDFGQKTSIISWTEDNQTLVVSHDYDGDERHRLYTVEVLTGTVTPLNEEHPEYFVRGGQITRDGRFLVYGANYDFETKQEIESTLVYKHDLVTGTRTVLARPEKPGYMWPELNQGGTHIIYERNDLHANGEQIWLVDIEGKEDREILNFGDDIKVSASWHPNGKEVVFLVEADTHRKVGLWKLSDSSIVWIQDDPTRNIEDAYVPTGSEQVLIDVLTHGEHTPILIDPATLEEETLQGLRTISPLGELAPRTWISLRYHSTLPTDLVVHRDSEIVRSLTRVFDRVEYAAEDLAKAEKYSWSGIDGLPIEGWLYQPKGTAVGTIVFVHGGPTYHSEDMWDLDIQYFVSEGFVVLDPNYRGSTGYGLAFEESIKEEGWGGKEQTDILLGIKSLIEDGIAEEGKVGITGTSYGGYSSWHAITHFKKEFIAAAIPICGMTDLVVDYESTRPDLRNYSEEMMGGSPTDVPLRYKNASPINFTENIEGKLLIVQGLQDPNVTMENVAVVEAKLQAEGILYEKLVFNDEGHGISNPANQKKLLQKSVAFFLEAFTSNEDSMRRK